MSPRSLLKRLLEGDSREDEITETLARIGEAIKLGKKLSEIPEQDQITLIAVVAAGGDRWDVSGIDSQTNNRRPTPFTEINPKPLQGGDMNQD